MERKIDRQKRQRQIEKIDKERQIDRQISQLLFIVDNIQSDKEKKN